jgi:hypothetical protein
MNKPFLLVKDFVQCIQMKGFFLLTMFFALDGDFLGFFLSLKIKEVQITGG